MIADQALALVAMQARGEAAVRSAAFTALQQRISSLIGSASVSLGLGSAAARLALAIAIMASVYSILDQGNQDVRLVPAPRTPWSALVSPVLLVACMACGILALVRIQGVSPAAATAFTLLHRTFTVKGREAVAVWHGGRSLGEDGPMIWWAAALLTWVMGFAFGWLSPAALLGISYALACGTAGAKWFTLRGNLSRALRERQVRMPALRCPATCALPLTSWNILISVCRCSHCALSLMSCNILTSACRCSSLRAPCMLTPDWARMLHACIRRAPSATSRRARGQAAAARRRLPQPPAAAARRRAPAAAGRGAAAWSWPR